jgi:hypothetical protein
MTNEEWMELLAANQLDLNNIVARFCPLRLEFFASACVDKNIRAAGEILQSAWEAAPDEPWIHKIPGWYVLCDLCTEFCSENLDSPA